MLIRQKTPGGLYPQITDAPGDNYFKFLEFFRGGQTIDDNLDSRQTGSTPQANMLKIGISSGYLRREKSPLPDFLIDVFLTPEGERQLLSDQDRKFCEKAVELAKKSIHEEDGEPHPFVGAVIVKDGKEISTGFRGELKPGDHAEYCALRKMNDDVDNVDLTGCTVFTTLEPCSIRKKGKTPCTDRLKNAKVARVVYGLADKDETVYGHSTLSEAGVEVDVFPKDLTDKLLELNKDWIDTRRKPETMPPPNDMPPLANVSYNKPGTPMTDNTHYFVRPPKPDTKDSYTLEDINRVVVAHAKTLDEIAVKWQNWDTQKTVVEKLKRQNHGASDQRFNLR
jgi:pyrimidine deaminase RibD-like protein